MKAFTFSKLGHCPMVSQYGEIPGPVNKKISRQKVKCIIPLLIIAVFCINTSEEYVDFGRVVTLLLKVAAY